MSSSSAPREKEILEESAGGGDVENFGLPYCGSQRDGELGESGSWISDISLEFKPASCVPSGCGCSRKGLLLVAKSTVSGLVPICNSPRCFLI